MSWIVRETTRWIADRDWVFLSTAWRFMIAVQVSTTKSCYHSKFRSYIKNTSNLKWLCIVVYAFKYWWLADTRTVKQTTSLAKQRLRYKESDALQAVPVINVPVWFPGKIDFSTFPASLKHVQPFPLDTIGTTQLCKEGVTSSSGNAHWVTAEWIDCNGQRKPGKKVFFLYLY